MMRPVRLFFCVLFLLPLPALAQDDAPAAEAATMSMVPAADVAWMPLDPEQPEGIRWALISGDPAVGPFRALLHFPPGFVSGMHMHTGDYTAVSLGGVRHRGASEESPTELTAGSYWIQPGGEAHFDNCVGEEPCVIYIEMRGPMDMTAVEAPGAGEVGMVMKAAEEVAWGPMNPEMPDGPQMAMISGDMATGPVTVLMRFPPGNNSGLHTHTAPYTAVVLSGHAQHGASADTVADLPAGSYWIQPGGEAHIDMCAGDSPCTLLIQLDGPFDMAPAE